MMTLKVPETADSLWPVRRGGWVLLMYQNLSTKLSLMEEDAFLNAWNIFSVPRFWQASMQN